MKLSQSTWEALTAIISDKTDNLNPEKYKKRIDTFCRILPQGLNADSRVLDIGTGTGCFSVLLKCESGCEVYGIDLEGNEEQRIRWQKRFHDYDIKLSRCDIVKERLPYPDEYFDLVLFQEILEHIIISHPPLGIFSELNRVLKRNAVLILSTPNVVSLNRRINCLRGHHPTSYGFYHSETHDKHFREYTSSELKWVCEQCGFHVDELLNVDNMITPDILSSDYIIWLLAKLYPNFRDTIVMRVGKR
jgi:ubiquinone/menaquinone biosynthesis C-methylase UbiE